MRSPLSPRAFSAQSLLLLAAASVVSANPYPKDDLHANGFAYLMLRDCDSYCGSDNQFCCTSGQSCTTLEGDVATCVGGAGGVGAYTTTWTRTYTSTIYTSWAPVPQPTAGVDCVPQDSQQQACGPICCAGWQTCAFSGQCSSRPGYFPPSTVVVTSNGVVTTQYSAPYRVTGTTTIVSGVGGASATATATSTGASSTASSDGEAIGANPGGTNHGGLSGGAIAGIVIGTLAGVALLLLLCFCCIARGLWNAIVGKKDREGGSMQEEVVEDRYSSKQSSGRVPSAYSRRDRHNGWFGRGGREEKKSSGAGWFGIAAAAATMLALLNLKKDKRPASHKTPSRYSESYYSYSEYTDPSSSSSGGRTNRSYATRDSRNTRRSQYSRQPKRS